MGIRKEIYESSMAVRCYEYLIDFCRRTECHECPFDDGTPNSCLFMYYNTPKVWPECIICDRPGRD